MTAPWIEIEEYQERDVPPGPIDPDYVWQALFACQVEILPHPEWIKLKWGFNASALFDEALERQRLFLESRYTIQNEGLEPADRCTLSLRLIRRPEEGVLVAVIVKILARTQADARESAQRYYRELKSTFPYDYNLVPACSRQEFFRLSGMDILGETNDQIRLAQIKRVEVPLSFTRNTPFLQGFWRSAPRAHEQIWRVLAGSSFPVLLNISLRSTFLYEGERKILLKSIEDFSSDQKTLDSLKKWHSDCVARLLSPWKKFFYLQIHVVSSREADEHLYRIIGTALTLSGDGPAHPGYRVICPPSDERESWRRKLRNLEVIFTRSSHVVPRLSEVADLEELFAAVRLPYSPPENGFPNMNFLNTGNR